MDKVGLTRESIYWMLQRTGLIHPVRKIPANLLRRIGYTVPRKGAIIRRESMQYLVDFERSRVVPLASTLYLNPHLDNREATIQELTQRLKQLRLPDDGEPVVLDVLRREDIYSGDHVDQAPDLYVKARPGVFVNNRLKPDSDVFSPKEGAWAAHHAPEGIFLVSGPSVCTGRQLDGLSIVDIAPTIMHLMDLEIPSDMDGRVILEAFESDSGVAKRKPRYLVMGDSLTDTAEEPALAQQDDDLVMERLRGLGYIE
jgi:hypothetical protein